MPDIHDGAIALCAPRADDPARKIIAGALPFACLRCDELVMVSPASFARLRQRDVILCPDCFIAVAEERGTPWIDPGRSPEQLEELAANGHQPRKFLFGAGSGSRPRPKG
jgi:hypothetical protein